MLRTILAAVAALCLLSAPVAAADACRLGNLESTIRSAVEAATAVHGAVLLIDKPVQARVVAIGVYADDDLTAPDVAKVVVVATPAGDIYLGMIGADGCFIEVRKSTTDRLLSLLKSQPA